VKQAAPNCLLGQIIAAICNGDIDSIAQQKRHFSVPHIVRVTAEKANAELLERPVPHQVFGAAALIEARLSARPSRQLMKEDQVSSRPQESRSHAY
jgi:hypothetical protein